MVLKPGFSYQTRFESRLPLVPSVQLDTNLLQQISKSGGKNTGYADV